MTELDLTQPVSYISCMNDSGMEGWSRYWRRLPTTVPGVPEDTPEGRKALGEEIKARRRRMKIDGKRPNQTVFAELVANVKQRQLQRVEQGDYAMVDDELVYRFAEAVGISREQAALIRAGMPPREVLTDQPAVGLMTARPVPPGRSVEEVVATLLRLHTMQDQQIDDLRAQIVTQGSQIAQLRLDLDVLLGREGSAGQA